MEKKIWFRRKLYGFGWTPCTWEGWAVLLVYVVFLVKVFVLMDRISHSISDMLIHMFIPYVLSTILLIYVCYKKGERPRWQWGKREEDFPKDQSR